MIKHQLLGFTFFICGIFCSSIIIQWLQLFNKQNFSEIICRICRDPNSDEALTKESKPTFSIYGKSRNEDHLIHVLSVLKRLGLRRVPLQENWDLLWSHDFPFRNLSKKLKNLESHQKVNHFPGCGFITNKVDLSVTNLPFQPKSYRLPKDKSKFIEYSKKHSNKLFVEKHNEHRHIFIKEKKDINLSSNEVFIQEFIDRPYLVDGYKFDIGVYVILTSVNPLRIYIYTGDVLFRYCTKQYYPFNSSIQEKYVVGDDYLPSWKVPSLKVLYNSFKFGMKDSFDGYVKSKKEEPSIIWDQIEDIVRQTILSKEKNIIIILNNYKHKKNFFELMRFDFVVDEKLKVWLMEANMSPNLSSAHFKQNSLLYEQLLYSMFQLVGVGLPVQRNSFEKRTVDEELMISSEKNLAVFVQECLKNSCESNCSKSKCKFCLNCLTKSRLQSLHDAYREHIHKADTKRIFPKPIIILLTSHLKSIIEFHHELHI
ncbi:probable tubulin polyglutamylase ttll-15 isoform X2 [Condylostylus longicornis]|uniref:probable tubulin polyglutamylase ttll-15 isoform X2 n=1 Tax=Condylostylus longicornis TaxID=2530218 RepID=UPI00244DC996|nr:probable tubulin polyglutamylase ttll-15 isoform X2 [Condylostylus longicornis]XP_055373909.1 probable tubulin polyglutamylase ttll-15 isoform X2 [Condylostylus longicornis]